MIKRYFVTYSCMGAGGSGFGNCEIKTVIEDITDIQRVARLIEGKNKLKLNSCVVLFFREFPLNLEERFGERD